MHREFRETSRSLSGRKCLAPRLSGGNSGETPGGKVCNLLWREQTPGRANAASSFRANVSSTIIRAVPRRDTLSRSGMFHTGCTERGICFDCLGGDARLPGIRDEVLRVRTYMGKSNRQAKLRRVCKCCDIHNRPFASAHAIRGDLCGGERYARELSASRRNFRRRPSGQTCPGNRL